MGDDNGYIQFGVPGFEYSKLVLPLGVDVEWAMERAGALTEAYRLQFGGGHLVEAAVAEGATPLATGEEVSAPTFDTQAPAAAPQAAQGQGGGQFPETWPPTVVATTDDDGNRVPGCSYHKLKDGRQRPTSRVTRMASVLCSLILRVSRLPKHRPSLSVSTMTKGQQNPSSVHHVHCY